MHLLLQNTLHLTPPSHFTEIYLLSQNTPPPSLTPPSPYPTLWKYTYFCRILLRLITPHLPYPLPINLWKIHPQNTPPPNLPSFTLPPTSHFMKNTYFHRIPLTRIRRILLCLISPPSPDPYLSIYGKYLLSQNTPAPNPHLSLYENASTEYFST